MLEGFHPRLSEAKTLLPLLRTQIAAGAPRHALPAGLALDLLPITTDGLFGYELVPDRHSHTVLTLGCTATREFVLRRTSYSADAFGAPRLATVGGRGVARRNFTGRHVARQSDAVFSDWPQAIDAAWAQLADLFPRQPRQCATLQWNAHRYFDAALALAHAHLSRWDPFILLFGLHDEAEQGFQLRGAEGASGTLISRRPDMWVLRWKSPEATLNEEWAVALPDQDAAGTLAQA